MKLLVLYYFSLNQIYNEKLTHLQSVKQMKLDGEGTQRKIKNFRTVNFFAFGFCKALRKIDKKSEK